MNTNTITISPATAGHLQALRALEQSHALFLEASLTELGGPDAVDPATLADGKAAKLWDAPREFLLARISEAVLNWANSDDASI